MYPRNFRVIGWILCCNICWQTRRDKHSESTVIPSSKDGAGCNNDLRYLKLNKKIFFSCWSYIGHIGGPQDMSLEVPGCIFTSVVQHEFIHALGFYHEQSRADRDCFVWINWDNIEDGKFNIQRYNRFLCMDQSTTTVVGSAITTTAQSLLLLLVLEY